MKEGILFVVSGPSGAGKGTVLKRVFEMVDNLGFSVSATTREPRPGEVDGVHYFFISDEKFEEMIKNGEMLEYVGKFQHKYGTPKKGVKDNLQNGHDVVLEIETTGAGNVKKAMPCVSIFIAPPSFAELWARLNGRMTDSDDVKKMRFETSKNELKCAYDYDYIVVNDDVEKCAREVTSIIEAERRKVSRNAETIEKILNN